MTLTQIETRYLCSRRVAFLVVRIDRGIETFDSMVYNLHIGGTPITQREYVALTNILGYMVQ